MATPILLTTDPTLTVGMGQQFLLTSTQLNTHEPTAQPYDIIITTLPTRGTLYNKGVPITEVPYSFQQTDINNGYIVYESDGLNGIVADSFVFKLSDREAAPNQTSTTTFDIVVNDENKGFLVAMRPVQAGTTFWRFSRKSVADAYANGWRVAHNGTITVTKVATDVTTWDNDVPLNQVDTEYALTDPDEYLDTNAVKNAVGQALVMLPAKSSILTHLIRMYGSTLETTNTKFITALTGTDKTDWDNVRSTMLVNYLANRFHNWIAALDLLQAILKAP